MRTWGCDGTRVDGAVCVLKDSHNGPCEFTDTECGNCGSPIRETDELHLVFGDDWCGSCADNVEHEQGDTLSRRSS